MNIENNALEKIKSLQSLIAKKNLSSSSIEKRDYNYEFTVSQNESKIKVQVYFGRKGIKTVVQG